MNAAVKITKLKMIEIPASDLSDDGIVAFQLVKFDYNFYGTQMSDVIDTKIMKDGSQIVIDGNGFIKTGYKLTN